tara:strand:- start:72 stop:1349 length:1278 start_codon:yes stop_codon:yes gene_type:complete
MKKVFTILLLLIVACGGSSEDTTTTSIEDTTTTTIPPVPKVDFDIIDIYNSKLRTELCKDSPNSSKVNIDIETASESCLKQYRDNLETVFSYAENLETYITELNTYLESYPSAMTEEYTTLFQFVNDDYQAVPETYGIVANKYLERFGGEPELLNLDILNKDELGVGCKAELEYSLTENTKKAEIIFENNVGEEIKLNLSNNTENFRSFSMVNSGGLFTVKSAIFSNYLGETYSKNIDSEFYVKFKHIKITKIYFDKEKVSPGESFKVYFEWENPENLTFFTNDKLYDSNILITLKGPDLYPVGQGVAFSDNLYQQSTAGYWDMDKKYGYVEFHLDAIRENATSGQQDGGRRNWIIGPEAEYFLETISLTMTEHLNDYSFQTYYLGYDIRPDDDFEYVFGNISICDIYFERININIPQESIKFEK